MADLTNTKTSIIHTWSGPRSLSTAFLYSFAQRPDCKTYDEPLSATYLRKYPNVSRPYREQLLAADTKTGPEVLQSMISEAESKLVFAKHMGKHFMDDLPETLLTQFGSKHIILIRNPLEMIMSWNAKSSIHNEDDTSDITNLHISVGIYFKIRKLTGETPIIVDVDALKLEPERILRALCAKLNIPFYTEQISWPAGPKPAIDG